MEGVEKEKGAAKSKIAELEKASAGLSEKLKEAKANYAGNQEELQR